MGYEGIEKVARSTGYLIRKAKLMPLAFLITLSFATYGTEGKLVSLTRYLSKWFNIQVDVQSISDRLNEKKTVDQIMYVSNKKIPLRLIAEKVPEEVKAQRAKRYKSERKKEPTEDYVTWNGFSVFITNIPKEMILSSCLIITIYKVRWNIELFFKRLKSIAKINIIKVESKNGVLCMVYAKLIGILLGEVIISYAASICDEGEELSEYKMTDWLQEGNTLGIAVKDGTWEELLVEMIRIFYLHCKDKRIKRKSLQKEVEDALQWESNETDNSELVA